LLALRISFAVSEFFFFGCGKHLITTGPFVFAFIFDFGHPAPSLHSPQPTAFPVQWPAPASACLAIRMYVLLSLLTTPQGISTPNNLLWPAHSLNSAPAARTYLAAPAIAATAC